MAGPTGDSIRALLAEWPEAASACRRSADPLLDGKPPAELEGRRSPT